MDSKTRKREQRKKLKNNKEKYELHLALERTRDKKRRDAKKITMDEATLEEKRRKDKERKRKSRQRKKDEQKVSSVLNTSEIGSFKSRRSLKKTVTKIEKILPRSPSKRIAVIKQLAKDVPLKSIMPSVSTRVKTPIDDIDKIKSFYLRDDISRHTPGIRDVKIVKNPSTGAKQKVQKRYLNMTVGECYSLFKEENPTIKIGKSQFYNYRPLNVCLVAETPLNMCLCIYHENIKFMTDVAHKTFFTIPESPSKVLQSTCCNIHSEKCMRNECLYCDNIYDLVPLNYNENMIVSWKYWTSQEGRFHIIAKEAAVGEFLKLFQLNLDQFKTHWYVNNMQAQCFQDRKAIPNQNEVVLQVDFAENFSIFFQDEIQSAHWKHPQLTIFTACAWVRYQDGISTQSYAIISDDLTHNKHSVWAFLKMITSDLKEKVDLKVVHIFSDGCASQFKNRYNIFNICHAPKDFGLEVTWNFFATGHGKGAVDGIGATVKRALWTAIKARECIMKTPLDCFKYLVAKHKLNKINVFYASKDDIDQNSSFLNERWGNVKVVKSLQKMHAFKSADAVSVYASYSYLSEFKQISLKNTGLEYCDVNDSE